MGVSCSCPLSVYCDLENGFESVVVDSIEKGNNDEQKPLVNRSISFKKDSEPTLSSSSSPSLCSITPVGEGSVRFRARKPQTMRFLEDKSQETASSFLSRSDSSMGNNPCSQILVPNSPKHEAAVKLQKVYKSFRTRRKLADCAVIIEQSWWKLLDFAELKHSSISFFDLEKHETAISRWSRARTRAAKVGKGLSKNSKAQKLALQHWLEAIDPRHRYGHNLHFYYVKWLHSQSKEPFFYWLDIGEGKEVNLVDKCPRSKLQQQCIKYLGPLERKAYEVAVEDGKLRFKQTGELLNTTDEPEGSKWIFVLSTSKTLYVGKKKKGYFQHSSFLAGGATLAAGRIIAKDGVLKAVWPHSGHYRPTPENFQDFLSFLRENNVDLSNVKLDPTDDDGDSVGKEGGVYLRSNSSEDDLTEKDGLEAEENDIEDSNSDKADLRKEKTSDALELPKLRTPRVFGNQIPALQIPSKDELFERLKPESNTSDSPPESPLEGYETAEELLASESSKCFEKDPVSGEEHDSAEEEVVPEEAILQRINSNKEKKSFQLGQRLSCKWCTGAGPRIGCLRDYPSGLQGHALEQVNLSPRSNRRVRFDFPSRSSTPTTSLSRSSSSSRR